MSDERGINPLDSTFKRVAELVRARDIFLPFAGRYEGHVPIVDVLTQLRTTRRLGDPVLVYGQSYGEYFIYESPSTFNPREGAEVYDGDTILNDCKDENQIDLSQCIASDTSIFDIVQLFARHDLQDSFFVVIEGNKCVGIVRFSDIMKPPGRVCLFALTLELELAAMQLCSRFAEPCFNSLSSARQNLTIKTMKRRHGSEADIFNKWVTNPGSCFYTFILDSTMMIDKATMITKCNLTHESNTRIRNVFSRAERLRNACAHPSVSEDEVPFEPKKLWELIHDCHDLIDTFKRLTPQPQDSV